MRGHRGRDGSRGVLAGRPGALRVLGPVIGLRHPALHMVAPQPRGQPVEQRGVLAVLPARRGQQLAGRAAMRHGGFQLERDLVHRRGERMALQTLAPQQRELADVAARGRQPQPQPRVGAGLAALLVAQSQRQHRDGLPAQLQPTTQGRQQGLDRGDQHRGFVGTLHQLAPGREVLGGREPRSRVGCVAIAAVECQAQVHAEPALQAGARQGSQRTEGLDPQCLQQLALAGARRQQAGQARHRQPVQLLRAAPGFQRMSPGQATGGEQPGGAGGGRTSRPHLHTARAREGLGPVQQRMDAAEQP